MDDRIFAVEIAARVLGSEGIDNLIPLAQEILEFLQADEVSE